MKKKWMVLFVILSFLLASTPQQGLTYLINHQSEFKLKKFTFTDNGIEIEVPSEVLAMVYGKKKEIGYSKAEAVPEEGGKFWKVTMVFTPEEEKAPGVKKELKTSTTPSSLLSPEEQKAVERLREERERRIKMKKEKSTTPPVKAKEFPEVKKTAPASPSLKDAPAPQLLRPKAEAPAKLPFTPKADPGAEKHLATLGLSHVQKNSSLQSASARQIVVKDKKKEKKLPARYAVFAKDIQKALAEPIDITLKGVPPIAFFDFLSQRTGLTVVPVGKLPSEPIDLFVEKTPLYKVTDIVLAQTGLSLLAENSTIAILGTIEEIRRLRQNKIILSQLDMGLPAVRIVRVKNIKVEMLKENLKQIYGSTVQVVALKDSQAVVLKGPESVLEQAEEIIRKIDKPKAQILIQAKIIEVSESEVKNLGIRWAVSGVSPAGASGLPVTVKTLPGLGRVPPTNTEDSFRALNESPVFGQVLKIGAPHNIFQFEAALSGLVQRGKAKVLSSPYVTVEEGEEGRMEQVKEIPYTFVNNWLANVSFRNAGLILKVTPYVVDPRDHLIKLKVRVESSAPDFSREVRGLPPIDRQSVEVVNVVKDGEYRVLGGLKIKKETRNKRGIPVLSSIPILKHIFSSKNKRSETYELLIVIRPKVQEV